MRSGRGEKGEGNSFGGHCCDCGCGCGGRWHVMRLKCNLVVGRVDGRGSLFFCITLTCACFFFKQLPELHY